jgi:hypothetical protein
MPFFLDSSVSALKVRNPKGGYLSLQEIERALHAGEHIWNRWAIGTIRRRVRISAASSGRQWSGAWFPSQNTVVFSTDWIWPSAGSLSRVYAHERGHVLGIANHRPNRGRFIMEVGAEGFHGQLNPAEVRWLLAFNPRLNTRHNFHPDVKTYHHTFTRSRVQYATLGTRIRELRKQIKPLRVTVQSGTASQAQIHQLQKLNARLQRWLNTRTRWAEEWDHWTHTTDPDILRIAKEYGSYHKPLLPEQRRNTAQITGREGLLAHLIDDKSGDGTSANNGSVENPFAMFRSDFDMTHHCLAGGCEHWDPA